MVLQSVIFYLLAVGAVASALLVIAPLGKRWTPIHSAISLVGCFFCVAGIYVLLYAHFIAALQVIVYAGAIMVLFLFVIMLLNLRKEELGQARITITKIIGGVATFLIAAKLVQTIVRAKFAKQPPDQVMGDFGSAKDVGMVLFQDFLFPFEVASILLLAAIVGAVVLAKSRSEGSGNSESTG